MEKGDIIQAFPLLANDKSFIISSPDDDVYNCLAWAYMMYNDRWMWPPLDDDGNPIIVLDGRPWWSEGVTIGLHINCLVEAFEKKGFVKCETWEHEDGYIKVALYYNPNIMKMTHAARESRQHKYWMSKLGYYNDIHHGSPYTIEGEIYGKVYCIMKCIA